VLILHIDKLRLFNSNHIVDNLQRFAKRDIVAVVYTRVYCLLANNFFSGNL
jgi:hypothetical protein